MDGSDAQQEGRKPPSTKAAGPTFAVMFCIPAESKAPAEPIGPWNPVYSHAEKSQGVGINTEINHRCIQCPESVRSATGALTRQRDGRRQNHGAHIRKIPGPKVQKHSWAAQSPVQMGPVSSRGSSIEKKVIWCEEGGRWASVYRPSTHAALHLGQFKHWIILLSK